MIKSAGPQRNLKSKLWCKKKKKNRFKILMCFTQFNRLEIPLLICSATPWRWMHCTNAAYQKAIYLCKFYAGEIGTRENQSQGAHLASKCKIKCKNIHKEIIFSLSKVSRTIKEHLIVWVIKKKKWVCVLGGTRRFWAIHVFKLDFSVDICSEFHKKIKIVLMNIPY